MRFMVTSDFSQRCPLHDPEDETSCKTDLQSGPVGVWAHLYTVHDIAIPDPAGPGEWVVGDD